MLISVNGNRLPPGWWELEEAENMWFLHDLKDILAEHGKLDCPEKYYRQAEYAKRIMKRVDEYVEKMGSYKKMETEWMEGRR